MNGVQIRIRGKVQGVGFRPFVWQLAQQSARCGDVCNDGDGVLVRLLGDEAAFLAALTRRCPPLARIDSVETGRFTGVGSRRISPSAKAAAAVCVPRLCPMRPPVRRAWRR